MANFQSVISRRQRAMVARYGTDAEGHQLRSWWPEARGNKAGPFPLPVACQEGTAPGSGKDLTGVLDRRTRTTTISLVTADLPAVFRRDGRDLVPSRQTIRLGYVEETAAAWEVSACSSSAGITQLELELVS